MGMKNLPAIVENLVKEGRPSTTPVAVIRWGTKASQQTVVLTAFTNPATTFGQQVFLRVDGEWMLVPNESGVAVSREHGKGDVAFRGSAQILLLALWRRISVDEAAAAGAEVFGDLSVLNGLLSSLVI